MDLGTIAAVVGIAAAVVYIAETGHKYAYQLYKRISQTDSRIAFKKTSTTRSRPLITTSLKNVRALLDTGARQILLVDPDSVSPTNLNRLVSCPK
jgi:hypothetical protein